jgi:hypothetical protein
MGVFWLQPPAGGGGGGGGGDGTALAQPIVGTSMMGLTEWNRPLLASLTGVRTTGRVGTNLAEFNTSGKKTGPIVLQSVGNDPIARGAVMPHGYGAGAVSVVGLINPQFTQSDPIAGPAMAAGLALYDSKSGAALFFGSVMQAYDPERLVLYSVDNTGSATLAQQYNNTRAASGLPYWVKITLDGAGNFSCSISGDGLIWTNETGVGLVSTYFTDTPDSVGFMSFTGNCQANAGITVWELFTQIP